MRLGKGQRRNEQAGESKNFFDDASFLMSKSLELVWIEQEPVRVFATAHFQSATAQSGRRAAGWPQNRNLQQD